MGPRNCIGQNFAQVFHKKYCLQFSHELFNIIFAKMVGKVFIAKVIKNFDITLDPSQNFGIIQEATLRPYFCFDKQFSF